MAPPQLAAPPPGRTTQIGGALFATAIVLLGVQAAWLHDFVLGLEPVPVGAPLRALGVYATVLVLVGGGVLALVGWQRRVAAWLVAALLALWIVALHLPKLALAPRDGTEWGALFETLALFGAAWLLAANAGASSGKIGGPLCFGLSLPAFGVFHFVYRGYIVSVIPSWVPAPLFFTYFTGVAHIAAGLAITTRIRARLASTLATLMFGLWVLLLHIPRVTAAPHSRDEWTSLFIAVAMCGGAWLVAGEFVPRRQRDPSHTDRGTAGV